MTFANSDGVSTGISPPWFRAVRAPARDCNCIPRSSLGMGHDGERLGGHDAVLSRALCLVERGIRGRNQLALPRRGGEGGDAETRRDLDHSAVGRREALLTDRLADPLPETAAALEVRAGQKERELLAAPAAREVDLADALAHPVGEGLEHLVAGRMAPAVVDPLEVVDVSEDQRQRLVEALRPGELLLERGGTEASVRETRQAVDERPLLDRSGLPRIAERDHGVADEPTGALALVRSELVAVEDQRAEVLAGPGGQRELELRGPALVAERDQDVVPARQLAAGRAGGLDGGLDDHA